MIYEHLDAPETQNDIKTRKWSAEHNASDVEHK